MKATTLAEVARLAGVSQATASRALNGSTRTPRPALAERVRRAAESLGYIPNAQAQSLARNRSGLAGLIVHDIADPYFAAIARGAQRAAAEQGNLLLVASTGRDPLEELAAVEAFVAQRTETIVLTGSRCTRPEDREGNLRLAKALDDYCNSGGDVGIVGEPIIGAAAPGYRRLGIPNEELASQLAAHLAETSEEFLIVGAEPGIVTSDDRIRGFHTGLGIAGAKAEVLRTGFDRAGGYEAGRRIAARMAAQGRPGPARARPCIFAVSDMLAIGVLAGLRSSGLEVPRDALLAGFDDIETLRYLSPSLSTVRLPLDDIGYTAASRPGAEGERPLLHVATGQIQMRASTDSGLAAEPWRACRGPIQ